MFDAKSILDILVRGGAQPRGERGQQGGFGELGDLLGQLAGRQGQQPYDDRQEPARGGARTPHDQGGDDPRYQQDTPRGRMPRGGMGGQQDQGDDDPRDQQDTPRGRGPMAREEEDVPEQAGPGGRPGPGAGGGLNLEELLRSVLGGGQAGPGGSGGSLQDMLRDLLGGAQGGSGGRSMLQGEGGQGNIVDTLRQVLGQAASGVREGAGRLDEATGASDRARDALGQATGQSPEELIAKLKELIANNRLGAGAALGGLGALILGTGAGRSLAANAVKLGGLAMIGGLAYKAYQNYQQGRPALGGDAEPQQLLAAPEGSGFEASAVSNDQAMLLIRAMIAAAAADGRVDAAEQKKILGNLKQGGLDTAAQQFLTREINTPASVEDLAGAVASQEQAVQVYTAARIAVDPDTDEEHEFLADLADALDIDEKLAAQIDATARSAAA